MDTRHLAAFLAVAEELHFGRAAARLHLTQSALSQQIKRLERDIGVELVSRTSRVVRLTPAGHAFRADAERILGGVHRATDTARHIAAGHTGKINIGFNGRAGQLVMPRSLARLHANHPNITPKLSAARSGPQLAALARDELDVGLLYGEPAEGRLRSRSLLALPIGALVGAGHEWADRPSVPTRELATQPCVMFHRDQSPAMHDALMAACARVHVSPRIGAYINDPTSTEIMVAARAFIAFASFVSIDEPRPMGLKVVPLVDPTPTVHLQATWRTNTENQAVQAFLDSLDQTQPTLLSTIGAAR